MEPQVIQLFFSLLVFYLTRAAGQGVHGGDYKGEPSPYQYEYKVHDDKEYLDFGQEEESDGNDNVHGYYYVQLPDGRHQRVDYHVNGYSGYVAEVKYDGESHHPSGGYQGSGHAGLVNHNSGNQELGHDTGYLGSNLYESGPDSRYHGSDQYESGHHNGYHGLEHYESGHESGYLGSEYYESGHDSGYHGTDDYESGHGIEYHGPEHYQSGHESGSGSFRGIGRVGKSETEEAEANPIDKLQPVTHLSVVPGNAAGNSETFETSPSDQVNSVQQTTFFAHVQNADKELHQEHQQFPSHQAENQPNLLSIHRALENHVQNAWNNHGDIQEKQNSPNQVLNLQAVRFPNSHEGISNTQSQSQNHPPTQQSLPQIQPNQRPILNTHNGQLSPSPNTIPALTSQPHFSQRPILQTDLSEIQEVNQGTIFQTPDHLGQVQEEQHAVGPDHIQPAVQGHSEDIQPDGSDYYQSGHDNGSGSLGRLGKSTEAEAHPIFKEQHVTQSSIVTGNKAESYETFETSPSDQVKSNQQLAFSIKEPHVQNDELHQEQQQFQDYQPEHHSHLLSIHQALANHVQNNLNNRDDVEEQQSTQNRFQNNPILQPQDVGVFNIQAQHQIHPTTKQSVHQLQPNQRPILNTQNIQISPSPHSIPALISQPHFSQRPTGQTDLSNIQLVRFQEVNQGTNFQTPDHLGQVQEEQHAEGPDHVQPAVQGHTEDLLPDFHGII